jgi:ABC-type uncharacterized transport system ATPase subunit
LSAHRIARAGVARTYQIPRLDHLTVIDNVAVPAMFGAAHLDRRAALREARRWLEFTDLADKASFLPETSICTSGSFWNLLAPVRRATRVCCWTKCFPA